MLLACISLQRQHVFTNRLATQVRFGEAVYLYMFYYLASPRFQDEIAKDGGSGRVWEVPERLVSQIVREAQPEGSFFFPPVFWLCVACSLDSFNFQGEVA